MCGKLGRARSIISIPNERFDAKGNKNKGFFKDLFVAEISQLCQMMPFCHLQQTDISILACSKETIKPTELKYSLKESLFYIE